MWVCPRLRFLRSTELQYLIWYSVSQNVKFNWALHIALWKLFAQSISFIKASLFLWRKQTHPSYSDQFLINTSLVFLTLVFTFEFLDVFSVLKSCFLLFCRFQTSFVPGTFSFWKYMPCWVTNSPFVSYILYRLCLIRLNQSISY